MGVGATSTPPSDLHRHGGTFSITSKRVTDPTSKPPTVSKIDKKSRDTHTAEERVCVSPTILAGEAIPLEVWW